MPKKKAASKNASAASKEETPLESALKQAIAASGLTHYALAKLTAGQVDPPRISRFMAGEAGITLHAAGVLCEALGLRLAGD